MSIVKVIELIGNSSQNWEEATKIAVKNAAKTIKNIQSVYVKEQSAVVSGENLTEFRVIVKVSYLVEDSNS